MRRRTDPSAATVRMVRDRDGWACVRCGHGGVSGGVLSTQHRIARGMGGTRDPRINKPSNLITLCGSGTTGCHGWVEAHPVDSRVNGWTLSRVQDPNDVPGRTGRGWLLLDDDGSASPTPPPAGTR